MSVELDHTIVPSHHKVASAKLLAELLGVPWAEVGLGPFSPVYVNEGLTLDFIETEEPLSHLSLLLPRGPGGIQRNPWAHQRCGHQVPQFCPRSDGHEDQHRIRRKHGLLERARRSSVGNAHG